MANQVPTKVPGGLSLCLTRPDGTHAAVAGNPVIAAMDPSEDPSSCWRAYEKTNPLGRCPCISCLISFSSDNYQSNLCSDFE